jgi:hypothetical protein
MPIPILNKIFGKSKVVKNVTDTVSDISDDVVKRKTMNNREATTRHKHDMLSDSWLSKNIRPGLLAVSYVLFFVFSFMDGSAFEVKPVYTDLLRLIFSYALPFYYGGRFLEKIAVVFSRSFKNEVKERDKS